MWVFQVDRAMTKATIQVGKKKCKCSYEMNAENCKKSKIVCDKKCSGKESGVELADGDVMYMVDIAVKKGKVTIAKCDVEAPGRLVSILEGNKDYIQSQLKLVEEALAQDLEMEKVEWEEWGRDVLVSLREWEDHMLSL